MLEEGKSLLEENKLYDRKRMSSGKFMAIIIKTTYIYDFPHSKVAS